MTPHDSNDPTVDENGLDLSVCYGLRERLEQIDEQHSSGHRSLDLRAMREALLESLDAIREKTDCYSEILSQLAEALRLSNKGKLHPLFATRQEDRDRAEPAESIAAVEAMAAAIIHYQKAELGIPKQTTSDAIAKYLDKKGYRYADGKKEYTADYIGRWVSKYQDANWQGHFAYLAALEMLYKFQPYTDQPDQTPLGLIDFTFQTRFIRLTPKKRRKY